MIANVVSFQKEVVSKLALKTKVPRLCIRIGKLRLVFVVPLQCKKHREEEVSVEQNSSGPIANFGSHWCRHLCRRTRHKIYEVSHELEEVTLERWVRTRVAEQVTEDAIIEDSVAASN